MNTMCPVEKIRNITTAMVNESQANDEILLIDVRENWEFERGHIKGAYHIPMREIPSRLDEISKDKKVVLYCQTGNRSLNAAMYLCSLGYDNIINMNEGIIRWVYGVETSGSSAEPGMDQQIMEIFKIGLSYTRGMIFFYEKIIPKVSEENTKEVLEQVYRSSSEDFQNLTNLMATVFKNGNMEMQNFLLSLDQMYKNEESIQLSNDLQDLFQKKAIEEELALKFSHQKEAMGQDFFKKVVNFVNDANLSPVFNQLYTEKGKNMHLLSSNIKEFSKA